MRDRIKPWRNHAGELVWYRNAGYSTRYHVPREGWVAEGVALCGARIAAPGYVHEGPSAPMFYRHTHCQRCHAVLTGGKP